MKYRKFLIVAGLLILCGLLAASGYAQSVWRDFFQARESDFSEIVIAEVNGEAVTQASLERTQRVILLNQPGMGEVEAYQQAFETIVRRKVLTQAAEKSALVVTREEARRYWQEMYVSFTPELRSMYEQAQKSSGLDAQEYSELTVERYQEELLAQKFFAQLALQQLKQQADQQMIQGIQQQWLDQARVKIVHTNLPDHLRNILGGLPFVDP